MKLQSLIAQDSAGIWYLGYKIFKDLGFFTLHHGPQINRYMNSVNLIPIDIDPSEFGENFDPLKIDFESEDRQKTREFVLKVLRKIVDLSNSSLQKNADELLATKPHQNQDVLWCG